MHHGGCNKLFHFLLFTYSYANESERNEFSMLLQKCQKLIDSHIHKIASRLLVLKSVLFSFLINSSLLSRAREHSSMKSIFDAREWEVNNKMLVYLS
jgi:hypothetical protein